MSERKRAKERKCKRKRVRKDTNWRRAKKLERGREK